MQNMKEVDYFRTALLYVLYLRIEPRGAAQGRPKQRRSRGSRGGVAGFIVLFYFAVARASRNDARK